jgi:hypothetical protein
MRRLRPHLLALVLVGFSDSTWATDSAAGAAEPQGTNAVVTVQSLAADPKRYLGQAVRVRGTLHNAGRNYFTDLRVELRDESGHSVAVEPWLPASLPPGPKRPGSTPPRTLSTFLGKQVELVAELLHGERPKAGAGYFLKVKTAELVQ